MYNYPIENDVLWKMFYNGWTYDDFKKEIDKCERLHCAGKMHISRVERTYIEVEYLESEVFEREYGIFAQI